MTQHFLLPCSCGQKIRVANSQAGGQVACGCGKSLVVPTLRGLRDLELAPPEVARSSRPGWSPVHGAIFASGLVAAMIGLGMAGYSLLRYTQIAGLSTDRSADVIQFESANIDKLTPLQLLGAWSELKEEGIGEKQTPIWIAAKAKIREYRSWMVIGGGVLVAGSLISLATLFIGRRSV